ncbi:nucleotide pyrophosphohydrolase [Micromonospora zhanjiangensis]
MEELTGRVRAFAAERDWQPFHTPKNLAMALAGEVGELLAELQWLTPEESARVMADPEHGARVRAEIADVTIYLVRLADVLGVDLLAAAADKLADSAVRYPVERARGSAAKAPGISRRSRSEDSLWLDQRATASPGRRAYYAT